MGTKFLEHWASLSLLASLSLCAPSLLAGEPAAGGKPSAKDAAAPAANSPAPATTETAPPKDPAQEANDLEAEGKKQLAAKAYDKAVVAFASAYQLSHKPQTLLLLARAELALNRHALAAKHFQAFLDESREPPAAERTEAQAGLAKCKPKVGVLVVKAEPPGAKISVDGESMGVVPLASPIYVEPGSHVLEGTMEGRQPARERVALAAGTTLDISLQLTEGTSAVVVKQQPPVVPPPPVEEPKGPNKTLLYAGIGAASGLALAGIGIGIAGGVYGSQSHDEWDANGCTSASAACRAAFDEKDKLHSQLGTAGIWLSIGAVTVGAATLVYALTAKKKAPENLAPNGAVLVLPGGGAAVLSGRF